MRVGDDVLAGPAMPGGQSYFSRYRLAVS